MADINDDEGMMIDEVQEYDRNDMNESLRIIRGILRGLCKYLQGYRGTVNANIEDYVGMLVGDRYRQQDIDNINKIIVYASWHVLCFCSLSERDLTKATDARF